jgi:hypothetical protein
MRFSKYQDLGRLYGLLKGYRTVTGETLRRELEVVRMGGYESTV